MASALVISFVITLVLVTGFGFVARNKGLFTATPLNMLAISIGFSSAYFIVYPGFSFPPVEVGDYIFIVILLALAFALLSNHYSLTGKVALIGQIALVTVISLVLLFPLIIRQTLVSALVDITLTVSIWMIFWKAMERQVRDHQNVMLIIIFSAGNAVIVAVDGSLLFGVLLAVLAVSTGAWWLMQLWTQQPVNYQVVTGFLLIPVVSLVLVAHHYSEINIFAIVVLLLIPVIGFIEALLQKTHTQLSAWVQYCRLALLGSLPVLVALWLVWPDESLY